MPAERLAELALLDPVICPFGLENNGNKRKL
jgi:hypothetical protein